MGCILRVKHDGLDAAQFLANSSIRAYKIFCGKGSDSKTPNAFNSLVSRNDDDSFELQVRDAEIYIDKYREDLLKLNRFEGGRCAVMDFYCELNPEYPFPSFHWPPSLLRKMGEVGIELEATIYPMSRDESSEDDSTNV